MVDRLVVISTMGFAGDALGRGGKSAQAAVGHSPNSNRCDGIDAAILCQAEITSRKELAAQLQ